jgi:hypothetical protein
MPAFRRPSDHDRIVSGNDFSGYFGRPVLAGFERLSGKGTDVGVGCGGSRKIVVGQP